VVNLLDALPEHYKLEIGFTNKDGQKSGKFKDYKEPKLAYLPKQKRNKKAEFLFVDSYQEMLADIRGEKVNNEKGCRVPYDWTLYYLRNKALSEKIKLEELAWVLLSYNQKRGYEKNEIEDKSTKGNELIEEFDLLVKNVIPKKDQDGKKFFEIHLGGNDQLVYNEFTNEQKTFQNDLKEVVKKSFVKDNGDIELEKTEFKIVDIYELSITSVQYKKENGKHKYTLTFDNGWIEEKPPFKNITYKYKNAENKPFDYIVETTYSVKGNIKKQQGKERKLRDPDLQEGSSDWTLLKKKTEKEALAFNAKLNLFDEKGNAKNYISPSIYETLKKNGKTGERTKIIGGMFQVVDRKFYREELNDIISTQRRFHNGLKDRQIFEQCLKTLYPRNKNHRDTLLKNKNAIQHLLVDDILLYQRPLKSKKSEIANCKYEIRYWKDVKNKDTGEVIEKKKAVYIKVVSASHPYFQEFRIWDKLHNLKLIELEQKSEDTSLTNQDVTKKYFKSEKEYQELFEYLNNRKSLNQNQFLEYCKKKFKIEYKKSDCNYAWNFPNDEELKGNETRVSFATRFKRRGFKKYADFLTQEKERELWHYLYSVNYKERRANNSKSITTFFNRFLEGSDVSDETKKKIIEDFTNYPKFASKYCAYSEKALKKLIPLIQKGDRNKIYCWQNEDWYMKWQKSNESRKEEILRRKAKINFSQEKIDWKIFVDNYARIPFPKGLFNAFRDFERIEDFTNLDLTKASYLVYGRHSELAFAKQWQSPQEIRDELHQELKQHSLNNPVAEKVLLEMMQVVADIWDYYGKGTEGFFTNINLEVGRELKQSAKKKESDYKRMSRNRAQNKRIRQELEEFLANNPYNANSKNSDHFERLKIVEEGAEHSKNTDKEFFKDKSYSKSEIEANLKKTQITKSDFEKYKLWIEQGYRSPYSGQVIRLVELFDGTRFNIDHIFPEASITNNSLSNKVVVEVELNKLKSNKTARAFIQEQKGQPHLGIPVCTEDEFVKIVKTQFSGTKRYILLSRDIPKGFTNSQMNNARHIARKGMELLSHIVREKGEVEFRSKNVLPVTGMVTTELKRAWKLDQVWRELMSKRFIRLNKLTQSNLFGSWQKANSGQKYFDCNLDNSIREKDESYDIKRIDHRHHALDALIVALCTEEHVHYLNNINSNKKRDDFGKQKRLEDYRLKLKQKIMWSKPKKENPKENNWYLMLPGEKRKDNAENSRRDSVIEMSYHYKEFDSFSSEYKSMILAALHQTVVTFKQNLRVINKTVNYYNNTPNKNSFESQKGDSAGNKTNWAIRRQLSKDTVYGKRIFNNEERRVERELLNEKFNRAKIEKVTDKGIKRILSNHLSQFDTVELPFEAAITYFDALIEKQEIEAILNDEENGFKSLKNFIEHLKLNEYKYNKVDYSRLNIFVDDVTERDFRNEEQFDGRIAEHPEIAFTPGSIEEMNKLENLLKLNRGKPHMPIRKVQTFQGLGKERSISDNNLSVKSKQYVVTAAGSNLYLGFYERVYQDDAGNYKRERKFKDIGLMDLIETLKQDKNNRYHPLAEKLYDDKQNEYSRIFTLSPLDLVYVPTEEEIENPSQVDFKNLTNEQVDRIYKYVDGSEDMANFVPYSVSKPIWRFHGKRNKEIFKELNDKGKIDISEKVLIQNEFGLGSQQNKNQNMIDGTTQVKKYCWKLKIDRLGNISSVER
jgi:CRISPR-associated endonuclease Csn1